MVERERVEDYVAEDGAGRPVRITQYLETLPGGRKHLVLEASGDEGRLDNTPVYQVPARHYFAITDTRDLSLDRPVLRSVPFIPAENLIGRAAFLFFSVALRSEEHTSALQSLLIT